jgi:hypothetical protein
MTHKIEPEQSPGGNKKVKGSPENNNLTHNAKYSEYIQSSCPTENIQTVHYKSDTGGQLEASSTEAQPLTQPGEIDYPTYYLNIIVMSITLDCIRRLLVQCKKNEIKF